MLRTLQKVLEIAYFVIIYHNQFSSQLWYKICSEVKSYLLLSYQSSLTSSEKASIYEECGKHLIKDEKLSKNFINLGVANKEWALNYLSSGKGTIP